MMIISYYKVKSQFFKWLILFSFVLITACDVEESLKVDILNPKNLEECRNLEEIEIPSDIPLVNNKQTCLSNYGRITGDFSKCNDEEKPYCMGGVAVKSNNFSLCDDESCFLAMGLSSNVNFCETFVYDEKQTLFIDFEKEARKYCKLGAAISKKDNSICKSFEEEDYLKYYCSINVAKQTNNKNICESLGESLSQECFFIIAVGKKDTSLCDKSLERTQECKDKIIFERAVKEQNPAKCFQLDDYYYAADCVSTIAENKSDEKLCGDLELGFGSVQEECYARVAMSKNDISLCEKSITSSLDDKCYATILSNSTNPVEVCKTQEELSFTYCVNNIDCSNAEDVDFCNNWVNDTKHDPSFCEYHLNIGTQTSCYKRLALELNTPALCLKVLPNKDNCLIEYALAKNNPDVCKLADGFCFIKYARELNDVSFCERITDDYQSECYVEFAKRWNDPSLCDKAPIEDFKTTCYSNLARSTEDIGLCEYSGSSKTSCLPAFGAPKQSNKYELYRCEIDDDCIIANPTCCGCSSGGTATAIHKDYKNSWEDELSESCQGTACIAVMSKHWTCFAEPKCVNGWCQLVKT